MIPRRRYQCLAESGPSPHVFSAVCSPYQSPGRRRPSVKATVNVRSSTSLIPISFGILSRATEHIFQDVIASTRSSLGEGRPVEFEGVHTCLSLDMRECREALSRRRTAQSRTEFTRKREPVNRKQCARLQLSKRADRIKKHSDTRSAWGLFFTSSSLHRVDFSVIDTIPNKGCSSRLGAAGYSVTVWSVAHDVACDYRDG